NPTIEATEGVGPTWRPAGVGETPAPSRAGQAIDAMDQLAAIENDLRRLDLRTRGNFLTFAESYGKGRRARRLARLRLARELEFAEARVADVHEKMRQLLAASAEGRAIARLVQLETEIRNQAAWSERAPRKGNR